MAAGAAIVVGKVNDRVTISFGETPIAWLALERDEAELLAAAILSIARRIPTVPPNTPPPDMPSGP